MKKNILSIIILAVLVVGPLAARAEGTTLKVTAFLGGVYQEETSLMSDGLRANGLVPAHEPYTALGYKFTSGEQAVAEESVFDAVGKNAIIDWVIVELRNPKNLQKVAYSTSALLKANGNVVSADGVKPLSIPIKRGYYHVVLKHRNHLAVMTAAPMNIGQRVDFQRVPLFGTGASMVIGGIQTLWPGDANFDGVVNYVGEGNDREEILEDIGGTIPTNVVSGYFGSDINMNGDVKYVGSGNDRDIVLQTIGGATPEAVRKAQLPE